MNFKIEINYLNIDNYPRIEKHFEEMASQGWMIRNVLSGIFFIYKKIEPKELDFSISPYEVETPLTRKSKADLEEFQSVSKAVGWEYVDKSFDLHIYFKAKHASAVPVHTDVEEEFNTIEPIAKRQLTISYVFIPLFFLISWWNIGNLFNQVHAMKNGFTQIAALFFLFIIMILIVNAFNLRKFLKTNRKNIEQGEPLVFNESKQRLNKILHSITFLIFLGLILYTLYSVMFLNNMTLFLAVLAPTIGLVLALLFRKFVKPIKKGLGFKLISVVILGVLAGGVSLLIDYSNIEALSGTVPLDNYKVVSFDHDSEADGDFSQNASLFIPTSYNYSSSSENNSEIRTEYSKALNESLAKNLVGRYIQNRKNSLKTMSDDIGIALTEGEYNPELIHIGFTEEDFNQLENMEGPISIGQLNNIIFTNSITKDEELWAIEEVYYLSYDKDEVLLRDENEVFYLSGLDFSDPSIVEEVKDQLALN